MDSIEDDETPLGKLPLIDLSDTELANFLAYLSRAKKTHQYDFLGALLTNEQLLRFLDLFSGEVIKVPSREELIKLVEYIQVYTFITDRVKSDVPLSIGQIPDTLVESASLRFDKRKNSVSRIYEKCRSILTKARIDVDPTLTE